MQIQLTSPKIWLATEPVDFRKGINGLSELVSERFEQSLQDNVYIFYNRAKNKLKLLAYHRNGCLLIIKALDKKKFTLNESHLKLHELNQQQLAWLLAGLDWVSMSSFEELTYEDYF